MISVFTLNNVLEVCGKAIPLYLDIAESEGQSGDYESFEYYQNQANQLEKLIKAIKEQLEIHRLIPMFTFVNWLNSEENKQVKNMILDAMEVVKENREFQIKKLQEEVDFCKEFLNCSELERDFEIDE